MRRRFPQRAPSVRVDGTRTDALDVPGSEGEENKLEGIFLAGIIPKRTASPAGARAVTLCAD